MNSDSLYSRLARAKGWGSAGQCPALDIAKTPAVGERVAIAQTSARATRQSVGGGVRA